MSESRPVITCPRCRRSTASPFAGEGVCLRCAGERVFAFETADFDPEPIPDALESRMGFAALPERVGPYEIIEELGRGGMGYIYAARQVGLGRIVALKVLPVRDNVAGLDLRFLREAQTVARLRHPHIVSVYDSGRAKGYVYFSMEYLVDGDLGRRLRREPFSPHAAAVMLAKIASGVAAAHAEGVLHRDIKPSNILLERDEPKLADFGLATELEAGGDLTAISGILGTPHYLAPEALRGGSAALTVASDIYALGAVLYECLTGRTPFAGMSPAELAAAVDRVDPPPPRWLSPGVPIDLQTICLTCLERDPGRRYPSAAALAADLQRFLNRQPIHARPPGVWDRVGKFASRHRAGFAAGLITALVLIVATAMSVAWALRARRAERAAAAEAATATAFADFLENDLLSQAGPQAQPDRNITLHTVIARAAKKIDGRFPHQPLVGADLHGVVGEVYDSLGDYDAARAHLERRVQIRREQLGEDDPRTLTAMHELAGVLVDAGKLAEAQALAERTLAGRRRNVGIESAAAIGTANMLGIILRERGKLADADRLATATAAAARRSLAGGSVELVHAVRSLGTIRMQQGRLPEAETLLREAADRQLEVAGAEDVASLTTLNDLAEVYRQERKLDDAARLFERVLATRQKVLGPEHPHTLLSLNNLAVVYRSQDRLEKAEALQVAAVELGTKTLGRDHPQVLMWLGNLAETYRLEHKLEPAAAAGTESLALSRRVNGDAHPYTISALGRLADIHLQLQQPGEAEPLLREAITASTRNEAPTWKVDSLRSQLGLALARSGRLAEAEPLLTDGLHSLQRNRATIPPTSRTVIDRAAERLAEFYALSHRTADETELRRQIAGHGL